MLLLLKPFRVLPSLRVAYGRRQRVRPLAFVALLFTLMSIPAAAATPDDPIDPADLTPDDELVVWSWRADTAERIEGVTPMVWVRFNYGLSPKRTGTTYDTARPDHEIARETLNAWHRFSRNGQIEDGRVALLLWYAGSTYGLRGPDVEPPLFPGDRKPEALAAGGLTDHTEDLMRRVAQRLHLAGLEPDFLVLDYEDGASTWHLGKRDREKNPVAWRRDIERTWELAGGAMPAALRDGPHREALLQPWPRPRESVIAFNVWATDRKRQALRNAVFEPWWEAFDRAIPASNYNDAVQAWPQFDHNGWPIPNHDRVAGNWSSPVSYFSARTTGKHLGLAPEQAMARSWLDRRNEVRAALAWSSEVAPWYPNPDHNRPEGIDADAWRWAWAAQLVHDRAHGVRRMLLWSGEAWSEEEVAFARRVFAALPDVPREDAGVLRPVPEDEAAAWMAGWVERTKALVGSPPTDESTPLR